MGYPTTGFSDATLARHARVREARRAVLRQAAIEAARATYPHDPRRGAIEYLMDLHDAAETAASSIPSRMGFRVATESERRDLVQRSRATSFADDAASVALSLDDALFWESVKEAGDQDAP